jgi:heme-degrading monooxygenase HmoA
LIIKRIFCNVKENQKEEFYEQQMQWKPLSNVKGFLGQIGGWNSKEPLIACVYSFWNNLTDYNQFMEEEHDQIFRKLGQINSYESIDVSLFREKQWIPGKEKDIVHVCKTSNYIRVAISKVKEDNIEHFVEMQRRVWNTGMQNFEGMLGGTFAQSQMKGNDFLILTGWKSEKDHYNYSKENFPELLKAANTNDDVLELIGEQFKVQEAWSVYPRD